jgi:hypothetical protein
MLKDYCTAKYFFLKLQKMICLVQFNAEVLFIKDGE